MDKENHTKEELIETFYTSKTVQTQEAPCPFCGEPLRTGVLNNVVTPSEIGTTQTQ
jgi:hypothetical protein